MKALLAILGFTASDSKAHAQRELQGQLADSAFAWCVSSCTQDGCGVMACQWMLTGVCHVWQACQGALPSNAGSMQYPSMSNVQLVDVGYSIPGAS